MMGLWVFATSAPAAAQPVSVRSEMGRFTVRVAGLDNPERLNHLHGIGLSIIGADGSPVSGALISISGQHHYAPNPLPTSPQVSPGDRDGSYRVEGLRFHIPGQWRLVLDVEVAQIRDRAVIEIVVK